MFCVTVIPVYGKSISAVLLDFDQMQAGYGCVQAHFEVAQSVVSLAFFPCELNCKYR